MAAAGAPVILTGGKQSGMRRDTVAFCPTGRARPACPGYTSQPPDEHPLVPRAEACAPSLVLPRS